VLAELEPRPGDSALDLYAGVGLFAGALAPRLGPGGRITAIESDAAAADDARFNLADEPTVRVETGRVDVVLTELGIRRADLVVLDPPRSGAGAAVVELVCRLDTRRIAYVSCDPASLARDVATFVDNGWRMTTLRAFDLFPMTSHVECLAVLDPPPAVAS
jgi:tRNA/tmRNA/rRNA uracil-C5-methylase (TrmA/RlmC/RlmD family)